MKLVALIASRTAELAQLAVDSLQTFAEGVRPIVIRTGQFKFPIIGAGVVDLPNPVGGAIDHANAIAYARANGLHAGADLVLLMDDDCVITSPNWLVEIQMHFSKNPTLATLGGQWLNNPEFTPYWQGQVIPHAHCLVMRRDVFERAETFAPMDYGDAANGAGRKDTASWPSVDAINRGEAVYAWPYRSGNLIFTECDKVQEYYCPAERGETLWAHLSRGTSFAPKSPAREAVRKLTALWSPRSQKILRRQAQREAYMATARAWILDAVRKEMA